ncbi:MAG TPA: carbon-nitrogen hydrolase [Chromatiaceae bacterium]|jgi:omega-amidase|nr:MAG: hypothetical protein N838_32225 [Thiohalocapsa sp. PB-PSB1]QQO56003.1 MAG: carbon-nitrogen family hydrolase [Thiohalocapsa sp. PB-PSB1]HBG94946.1 carbon-nitrogen hydrolase [Chromatiaceae bacterium]HCS90023.1 carbon-nitrogen hydrolase [Chromatiaceae bacterium]
MKIALAQIDLKSGDVTENVSRMVAYIKKAKEAGHEIVILPEMCDTGYDMPEILRTACDWSRGAVPQLRQTAKELAIGVIAGVSERVGEDVFNAVVCIDRHGEIVGTYRKTHLITAEPMREHEYLKAGSALGIIRLEGHVFGLMTCYEIRFPEIARALALSGAEILVIPAAWPLVRLMHWRTLVLARAIENQVYVAATGRLGNDTGVPFAGTSMIVGPYGNLMASGTQVHEGIISAEIDFEFIQTVRSEIKVHQDRREELYQPVVGSPA